MSKLDTTDKFAFWTALAVLITLVFGLNTSGVQAKTASAPRAATIQVYPGPNAIQNAINSANPGDTLNIHAGTYPEAVNINKANLTLMAAGDGLVRVDGQCSARITIDVTQNGAVIDGLHIVGAKDLFEVNFTDIMSGTLKNSVLRDTCDAEYGVNVFHSGKIRIIRNKARGFSDAGIYIGGITSTPIGALVARGNRTFGNYQGIIVEDSANVDIRVTSNLVGGSWKSGIFLHNSDGIVINSNKVRHKPTSSTVTGIELDVNSDNNQVGYNEVSGHTYDLANDGGSGNCFYGNTYNTSYGTISC